MNPDIQVSQRNKENSQLNTLVTLFNVFAVLMLLCTPLFGFYSWFGYITEADPSMFGSPGHTPPMRLGMFMFVIGLVYLGVSIIFSVASFFAASWIKNRQNWNGIVFVSGMITLLMPLGTALGIFSLITTTRESVKSQFFPNRESQND